MTMTWSQAFAAHLKRHKIKPAEVAAVLQVATTTVYYWLRGSEPRSALKRRVETWSRGEVLAAPWTAPSSSTDLAADVEHRSAS